METEDVLSSLPESSSGDLSTLGFELMTDTSRENIWCEQCKAYKQELQKLRAEHTLNYNTLKKKIISTDLLIKKYKRKCEDHDILTRKFDETVKKLEAVERDSDLLQTQLTSSLQQVEPVKKAKASLELELKQKCNQVQMLKDKLTASEASQKQFEHLNNFSSSYKEKFEDAKKEYSKKIRDLESHSQKQENQIIKLKEDCKGLKSDGSKSMKRQSELEKKLRKTLGKLDRYRDILKDNGLLPKGDQKECYLNVNDSSVLHEEDFSSGTSNKAAEKNDDDDGDDYIEDMDDNDSVFSLRWVPSPLAQVLSPLPPSPVPNERVMKNKKEGSVSEADDDIEVMSKVLEKEILKMSPLRRSPRILSPRQPVTETGRSPKALKRSQLASNKKTSVLALNSNDQSSRRSKSLDADFATDQKQNINLDSHAKKCAKSESLSSLFKRGKGYESHFVKGKSCFLPLDSDEENCRNGGNIPGQPSKILTTSNSDEMRETKTFTVSELSNEGSDQRIERDLKKDNSVGYKTDSFTSINNNFGDEFVTTEKNKNNLFADGALAKIVDNGKQELVVGSSGVEDLKSNKTVQDSHLENNMKENSNFCMEIESSQIKKSPDVHIECSKIETCHLVDLNGDNIVGVKDVDSDVKICNLRRRSLSKNSQSLVSAAPPFVETDSKMMTDSERDVRSRTLQQNDKGNVLGVAKHRKSEEFNSRIPSSGRSSEGSNESRSDTKRYCLGTKTHKEEERKGGGTTKELKTGTDGLENKTNDRTNKVESKKVDLGIRHVRRKSQLKSSFGEFEEVTSVNGQQKGTQVLSQNVGNEHESSEVKLIGVTTNVTNAEDDSQMCGNIDDRLSSEMIDDTINDDDSCTSSNAGTCQNNRQYISTPASQKYCNSQDGNFTGSTKYQGKKSSGETTLQKGGKSSGDKKCKKDKDFNSDSVIRKEDLSSNGDTFFRKCSNAKDDIKSQNDDDSKRAQVDRIENLSKDVTCQNNAHSGVEINHTDNTCKNKASDNNTGHSHSSDGIDSIHNNRCNLATTESNGRDNTCKDSDRSNSPENKIKRQGSTGFLIKSPSYYASLDKIEESGSIICDIPQNNSMSTAAGEMTENKSSLGNRSGKIENVVAEGIFMRDNNQLDNFEILPSCSGVQHDLPTYVPKTKTKHSRTEKRSAFASAASSTVVSPEIAGLLSCGDSNRVPTPCASSSALCASTPVSPLPPSPFDLFLPLLLSPLPPSPVNDTDPLSPLPESPLEEESNSLSKTLLNFNPGSLTDSDLSEDLTPVTTPVSFLTSSASNTALISLSPSTLGDSGNKGSRSLPCSFHSKAPPDAIQVKPQNTCKVVKKSPPDPFHAKPQKTVDITKIPPADIHIKPQKTCNLTKPPPNVLHPKPRKTCDGTKTSSADNQVNCNITRIPPADIHMKPRKTCKVTKVPCDAVKDDTSNTVKDVPTKCANLCNDVGKKRRKRKSEEQMVKQETVEKKQCKTVKGKEMKSLQTEPVAGFEAELKKYVETPDINAKDLAERIMGRDGVAGTIHPLVQWIVQYLRSTAVDIFGMIHCYCAYSGTDQTRKEPFLTIAEVKLLEFCYFVFQKDEWVSTKTRLLEALWNSIFLKDVTPLGRSALCRFYTGIAQLDGDIERVRVLYYKILTSKNLNAAVLGLAIAGVWPKALHREDKGSSPILVVMEHYVMRNLKESGAKNDKVMKCFSRLCNWSSSTLDGTVLLRHLVDSLQNKCQESEQNKTSIFELKKAVELMLILQNSGFFRGIYLPITLLQILKKFKFKQKMEDVDVSPDYIICIIQITGVYFNQLQHSKDGQKYFNQAIKKYFLQLLYSPAAPSKVKSCVVQTLLELSPVSPVAVMVYGLHNWFREHKNEMENDWIVQMENTRKFLLAHFPKFHCPEFII